MRKSKHLVFVYAIDLTMQPAAGFPVDFEPICR